MEVWELPSFGIEALRRAERVTPEPGPGEVRLRMCAASINYRDVMMVRGHYNPRLALPLVPLSDGVGVVDAVGPGVTQVALGDRVAPCFSPGWTSTPPTLEDVRHTLGGPLDGTLAESMVVPAAGVVRVPEHLSDAEAATLPCAALTAWSALFVEGDLRAGQTVLLLGTGGVSLFALQFAKAAGARVIITSSSDAKLERARALGADETINYRAEPAWGKRAKALTGGVGVDQVVEVGGAGTFNQSLRALKVGGTMSLIGVLAQASEGADLVRVLMNQIRVQGIFVGCRDAFEAMNRAIAEHALRPVVDRVFAWGEAPAALEHVANAKHFGKIVVQHPCLPAADG